MGERKSVLLRLVPELLARVDVARGALSRTEWLVEVISARLDALEASSAAAERQRMEDMAARSFGSHAYRRRIRDEDGTDLGLCATARDDGVLEISHATDTPRESGPAGEPSGDAAVLVGGVEGPDVAPPDVVEWWD